MSDRKELAVTPHTEKVGSSMISRRRLLKVTGAAALLVAGAATLGGCALPEGVDLLALAGMGTPVEVDEAQYYEADGSFRRATASDTMAFFGQHPVFEGHSYLFRNYEDMFLDLIEGMTLEGFYQAEQELNSLQGGNAMFGGDATSVDNNARCAVEAFNYLLDAAERGEVEITPSFYTAEEIVEDPFKDRVRGILLHGDPDMPLAIECAGGGFLAVGTDVEGLPYAMELHKRGYNVLVMNYRVGGQLHADDTWDRGTEAARDLARAVAWVDANSADLGVSLDDYAVIGSSAGGLMATSLAFKMFETTTDNCWSFGLPRPRVVICNYGLYWDIEPMPEDAGLAVYALVARDDAFGFAGVEDKIPALEETLGRDNVVVRILDNYWHGANLGEGTDGEGWIQDAMDFWEERREAWADGHDGDLVDAYVE